MRRVCLAISGDAASGDAASGDGDAAIADEAVQAAWLVAWKMPPSPTG
jgi:hypothetical protein